MSGEFGALLWINTLQGYLDIVLPFVCVCAGENMSIFGSNTHKMIRSGLGSVLGFPCGSDGKESACNAGDLGSISGSGRSPGERSGNPLQYSCLENPMDRGAWQIIVQGVAVRHDWATNTLGGVLVTGKDKMCAIITKIWNVLHWSQSHPYTFLMETFIVTVPFASVPSDYKESACNAEDPGSLPGSGRSPGKGNGYLVQCSCLENSTDRGAWWTTVDGITKSQTQLTD